MLHGVVGSDINESSGGDGEGGWDSKGGDGASFDDASFDKEGGGDQGDEKVMVRLLTAKVEETKGTRREQIGFSFLSFLLSFLFFSFLPLSSPALYFRRALSSFIERLLEFQLCGSLIVEVKDLERLNREL